MMENKRLVEQESHGARREQAIFENGQYMGIIDEGACGEVTRGITVSFQMPARPECMSVGNHLWILSR